MSRRLGIVRGSLTDRDGYYDVAYVSLFCVMVAVVGAIPFMCLMDLISYFRCEGACAYNPQPLGTAIGLACGGFATALGALAAYMAATRRPPPLKRGEPGWTSG